jgi:adenine/guanine phosphoribosyltransferase-like PRPP-binding protein
MSFVEDGWEQDFPRVMHFFDRKNLYRVPSILLKDKEKFPDYHAAKWGEDFPAAMRLVKSLVNTSENITQLHELKHRFPDAILAAVYAEESAGDNRIPLAMAEYIAKKAGYKLDMNILQANKVHRTGADEWHRMAFRPEFKGDVEKGRRYILIDDVCAHGGTFSEMRYFIEKNGGKVVYTAALALGGHGDRLASSPQLQKHLLDRFGANNLKSFCKEYNLYEGNYKCFTETEGRLIEHSKTLERAGDRIAKAKEKGLSRTGENSIQGRETSLGRLSREDGGIER